MDKVRSELEGEGGNANGKRPSSDDGVLSALSCTVVWGGVRLLQFGGFWLPETRLRVTLATQQRFTARPDDVFIGSFPKSGTTWLKALVFSTVHRRRHHPCDPHHPLRGSNPHECVENLEKPFSLHQDPDLDSLPSPRIWACHTPYSLLPESVRRSTCRMVYVTRDPKDTFVSLMCFWDGVKFPDKVDVPMHEAFELYCSGIIPYGPPWEHALECWDESVRRPEKVLFLRYEGMKADPVGTLRRLAEFLGSPFTEEEEREGLAAEISELCSLKQLSGMDANKAGDVMTFRGTTVRKDAFFRRGEVGDWKNHLSADMAERLDRITQDKLQGSGLEL